jgi:hypothetical protein
MEGLTHEVGRETNCSGQFQIVRQSERQAMPYIMDIYMAGSYHLPGARLLYPGRQQLGQFDERKGLRRVPLTPDDIAAFPKMLDITSKGIKSTPDFLYIFAFEGLIVSEKARSILEGMEPGKHHYIPLDHGMLPKYAREAGYSYLILTTVLDAVDITRSDIIEDKTAAQLGFAHFVFDWPKFKCSIRRSAIAGHHIWANKRPAVASHFFISDQLKEAWEAAACGPMQYLPCEAVD